MRIAARDHRLHVPDKGFQDGDAGRDIPNVDFEDAGHCIGYPDPGQIVRHDLPRRRDACNGDGAGDDAQAHERAQGDFAPALDVQVPEQDDGERGAGEVGEEGQDALGDDDVHDGLEGEAVALFAEVPGLGNRVALEDDEEEEGEVGKDEEGDEVVEDPLQLVEGRETQEEEADGDLAGGERDEELGRVEVGVFEEVAVLFHREVAAVLA